MKISRKILSGLILCFGLSVAHAQKIEIEDRISADEFPEKALNKVLEDYAELTTIKYYREKSKNATTYEAKLRWGGSWYSVEFDEQGNLIDVEKKIKFKDIPEQTKQRIEKKWEKDFYKTKVTRCQEQTSEKGIRYEIEVKAKGDSGKYFYEYLFEEDGTFVKKRKILLRSSDMNLY